MAKKNTSIEINGRRYDAVSGQLLTASAGRSIDGVLAAAGQPTAPPPSPVTVKAPALTAMKPTMDVRPGRKPAAKATARAAKPSATLMRHAVHKPATPLKRHTKAQTSTLALAAKPPAVIVTPKASLYSIDPRRQTRAAKIAQSNQVSHFGHLAPPSKHHASAKPPSEPWHGVSAPIATASESVITQPLPDMFDQALLSATSHQQPPLSKKELRRTKRASRASRRIINYAAAALALILLGGFLVYQNKADLTLKVANSKAGFAATLPGYRPSGFAVGNFSYSPGNVAVNFHSNSNNQHFALLEKPSNWDSATLLSDFVATASGPSYQTISSAGRTIYLYGQNNATWVNNGVWYVIHGNNALSDTQLSKLASSM